MQAVVDPLPGAAIFQQAAAAQQRQVAGDLWLALFQGHGQLADAQLAFADEQLGHTRSGVIGQTLEQGDRTQGFT